MRLAIGLLLATLFTATVAGASPCRDVGSASAQPLPDLAGMSKEQVAVLVSAPLLLRAMKVDEAAVRRAGVTCTRAAFDVPGQGAYTLTGEDAEKSLPRRAQPSARGGRIAFVVPVSDLLKSIEAAKSHAAVPIFYLLAGAQGGAIDGFRIYDALPDDARLQADMAEVLAGARKPIFRITPDGKTQMFTG